MVRSSMISLINTLRGFGAAGTADFTLGNTNFWSDEQLQSILDRYRVDIREAEMVAHNITNISGDPEYKEYTTHAGWWEETATGGTTRFVITDGLGSITPATSYTADYESGLVTFSADQEGSARYVTGHSYDIYAAAADVWEQKASHYATMIDFSTDGHKVTRSHIVAQCEKMISKYNSLAISGGNSSVQMIRGDYNGS